MGATLVCCAKLLIRPNATSSLVNHSTTHCTFSKQNFKNIAVWCGQGNNAGDGYFIASYLKQAGFQVEIFAAELGESVDLHHAVHFAKENDVQVHQGFEVSKTFDCHIDALFGIGLNRELNGYWQHAIQQFNGQAGLKISIDIPSGLHANTGSTLPCAIRADLTFTVLGLKAGLFTGQGKEYAGQIHLINLIPINQELKPLAYLTPTHINLLNVWLLDIKEVMGMFW